MVFVNNITARRNIVTKAAILSLCWITTLIGLNDAVNVDCNYYQDLTVPTTYYVFNPEYPYLYRGPKSCMWTMMSDYRVNLTCTTFELPWSNNCTQDVLAVKVSTETTHRYCGKGSFSIVSKSNTMIITLEAPLWSIGGRFLCEAKAVKGPNDSKNCRCGWKNPTRIIGGTETGVNEFPMMAGLVDSVNRNVFCGSTIISKRYVLSAAHCMIGKQAQQLGVLVGEHDLTTGAETNATVLLRVIQIIVHPNYIEGGPLNDLAVLKTNKEMIFGNQVGPACLPFQHSPDTFGGSFVNLLGWGALEFGEAPSNVLQKVTVSVITRLQCSESYKDLTPNQMCTYGHNKDSCQMDSGGPVLWQNPTTNRLVLIGIISMGKGCGITAGVNTRVGGYIDWIVSVTSDATYCIIE